jgi:flavin-dependent dehydrogenase
MGQAMSMPGTVSCERAVELTWDAIVMGAGVAGSMAARELARSGLRVLLVDKRPFPRPKVCGACLNATALKILESVGLSEKIAELGGHVLQEFVLRHGTSSIAMKLPDGLAVSRELLDSTLVEAAIAAGADFLPATIACIDGEVAHGRIVNLTQQAETWAVLARTVIVATGLGPHGLPENSEWTTKVSPSARVGTGCLITDLDSQYPSGAIWMGIGEAGYVGLVRVEQDQLNVAAAFDRNFLRRCGSPGEAATLLLRNAGCSVPHRLMDADWHGTVPLTRRTRPVARGRVFLIGDAAGYVEPFTGEGMAWGLATGLQVVPWVQRGVKGWSEDVAAGWVREHRKIVRRPQTVCRVLTRLLRFPRLLRTGVFLCQRWPVLLHLVADRLDL